jgi:hypothetical protein
MALTAEEITSQIADLGEKIKQAKIEKKTQEFWGEFLQSMLTLKVRCVTFTSLRLYGFKAAFTLHRLFYSFSFVSQSSRFEQTNECNTVVINLPCHRKLCVQLFWQKLVLLLGSSWLSYAFNFLPHHPVPHFLSLSFISPPHRTNKSNQALLSP